MAASILRLWTAAILLSTVRGPIAPGATPHFVPSGAELRGSDAILWWQQLGKRFPCLVVAANQAC